MTDDPRGRQDPSISAGFQHDDLDVSLSPDPAGGGVPTQGFAVPMLEPDGPVAPLAAAQEQPPAAPTAQDPNDGFVPSVPQAAFPQAPAPAAPAPAAPAAEPAAPPAPEPAAAPLRQSAFQRVQEPQAPAQEYMPPTAAPAHHEPAPAPVPTQAPFPGDPGPTQHDMSVPSLDDLIGPSTSKGRSRKADGGDAAVQAPFPVVQPDFTTPPPTPAAPAAGPPSAPSGEISFADDQMPAPAPEQHAYPAPRDQGAFPTDPAAPATTGGIFVPDVTAGAAPTFHDNLGAEPALDDLAPPTGEIPMPGFEPPLGAQQAGEPDFGAPASGAIPALEEDPEPAPQAYAEPPAPPARDSGAFDMPAPGAGDGFGMPAAPGPDYGFDMPAPGQPPAAGVDAFGSPGGDFAPQGNAAPNPVAPVPGPQGTFSPQGDFAAGPMPSAPGAFQPGAVPGMPADGTFSPDDLARPTGWEAAGMSAVSAEDESEYIGYRPEAFAEPEPMPDPEPVDDVGADADVASAVFSELSSLASVRPKVEKTRAGLVKRERQQPEATPEPAPEPAGAPAAAGPAYERDPEAVRTRVSSFYSGKFRAQADAAEFERTMQGASASEVTP